MEESTLSPLSPAQKSSSRKGKTEHVMVGRCLTVMWRMDIFCEFGCSIKVKIMLFKLNLWIVSNLFLGEIHLCMEGKNLVILQWGLFVFWVLTWDVSGENEFPLYYFPLMERWKTKMNKQTVSHCKVMIIRIMQTTLTWSGQKETVIKILIRSVRRLKTHIYIPGSRTMIQYLLSVWINRSMNTELLSRNGNVGVVARTDW